MRIYTDHNGLAVSAISSLHNDKDVNGHYYNILSGPRTQTLEFQRGAVAVEGLNGATNEALLAILIHRTMALDLKFPCEENKRAIQHMQDAMANFEARTHRRIVRGVEGKDCD